MNIAEHVETAYKSTATKDLSSAGQALSYLAWKAETAERTRARVDAEFAKVFEQYGSAAIHWGNLDELLKAKAEAEAYAYVINYSDRDFETQEEAVEGIRKLTLDKILHSTFTGGGSSVASNALEALSLAAFKDVAQTIGLGR